MRRFGTGLVVGTFAPLHRGHQALIEAARAACDHVVVGVWSNPEPDGLPQAVRAGWIATLFPDAEVWTPDPAAAPLDAAPPEAHHAFVRAHLPRPVDVVFTAEAYGPAFAAALNAEHVALDRSGDAVSGTAIRADVHAWRDALDPRVYAHFVPRIALLGAESTGKSTLSAALAERLGTMAVEEYGRTLWEERGGDVPLDDYVLIAERHRELEDAAHLRAHRVLVCDTNAITTQQYAFFYHGACPPRVQALAAECATRYARTLVCAPDFGLVQDGWRVHQEVQRYQDGAIRNDLTLRGIPYDVISGSVEARVEQVLGLLDVG